MICKISDFGLSRIISANYYSQSENRIFPYKWSAPEVVLKNLVAKKSDVFSFGVVLFEIFSKGQIPWSSFTYQEVAQALQKQERMPLPKDFGPQFIIDLMNECWKEDHHQRPTFKVNLIEKK